VSTYLQSHAENQNLVERLYSSGSSCNMMELVKVRKGEVHPITCHEGTGGIRVVALLIL
jgi:hypothetical protein